MANRSRVLLSTLAFGGVMLLTIAGGSNTSAAGDDGKYNGPPVLDPSNYVGAAAIGYASAKNAPEIVSHLFCYCGCDITDGHHNLIDCYTGNHGMDCHICQEEAVEALRLKRDGKTLAQIQKQIDEDFHTQYPFQQPSKNYLQYKASILYVADNGASTQTTPAGPDPAPTGASSGGKSGDTKPTKSSTPKLKKGFKVGSCCADGEKKPQQ